MNTRPLSQMLKTLCAGAFITFATSTAAKADDLAGLTSVGPIPLLVGMDSDQPLFPTSLRFVVGLGANENLVGIDLRPATGTVYGVARNSQSGALQLYQLALTDFTATATAVGTPFTPAFTFVAPTAYGFDFNPTIDRVRLVADNDINLVFNPNDGAVTVATNLFYATGAAPDTNPTPDPNVGKNPNVVHIAYDNNDLDPVTATQQRGIDTKLDVLVTVANNAGTLRTIGSLGVNAVAVGGYDVSTTNNANAFAIMSTQGNPFQLLFTINPTTGQATLAGIPVFGLVQFTGLTVLDAPAPPPMLP